MAAPAGFGDVRQWLDQALEALSRVINARLPLLLTPDQDFHQAKAANINCNEPFARLFEGGIADRSLAPPGGDPRQRPSCRVNTARRLVITSAVRPPGEGADAPTFCRGARRAPRLAKVHRRFLSVPASRSAPCVNLQLRLAASSQSLTRIRRYALADQRSYWSQLPSRYAPPSSIL